MPHIINSEVSQKIAFLLYRYRFFISYVGIGLLSLIIEVLILQLGSSTSIDSPITNLFAVGTGIITAYWLNARFNFKIPTSKRQRAFLLFILISLGSYTLNMFFHRELIDLGWSYEKARFIVAGFLFSIAYFFHRKYSFYYYKKVGVAVYANGVEDINSIYQKIGTYPDFIHVDIIDETFGETRLDPKSYKLEVIRAYWPNKKIHLHIMSQYPSRWIEETLPYADVIFFHYEIQENISELIHLIKKNNKQVGLCITMQTPPEKIFQWIDQIDFILCLTIQNPGRSGQAFDMDALERIYTISSWPKRKKISLCIDGGVNESIIGRLNVEYVVSGSSVLKNSLPKKQIMRLQTSSNYEMC